VLGRRHDESKQRPIGRMARIDTATGVERAVLLNLDDTTNKVRNRRAPQRPVSHSDGKLCENDGERRKIRKLVVLQLFVIFLSAE